MWSVGCIFAEMSMRSPLFPGDSEIDEIFKIFRYAPSLLESQRVVPWSLHTWLTYYSILGTPDEEDWPGVTSLPDYKSTFPQWSATPLRKTVSHMDHNGLDLLAQMLKYDPAQRISGESGPGLHVHHHE